MAPTDTTRERILEILYASIEELNEQLDQNRRIAKTPQAPLLGDGGSLDSLGFVSLIALVEEKCQERLGETLILTDGAGHHGSRDPFETVGSLASHIQTILGSKRIGKG